MTYLFDSNQIIVPNMNHYIIKVSGKVQGVFFRASTKDKASELSINGFVRNEADGSVYIEAEGDKTMLDKFVAWCHHGPEHASVTRCIVTTGEFKDFKDFMIQR